MNGAEARYLVLNQTPAVLSIGRRVMENGYDFVWRAGEQPHLSDADGHEFELQVINNVPYWFCDRDDGQGVRSGELAVPGDPIAEEEESEQDASTSHQASGRTVASSEPHREEERCGEPEGAEEVRVEPRSPHAPEEEEGEREKAQGEVCVEPWGPHTPKEQDGEVERSDVGPDEADEQEKVREEEWVEWNPLTQPEEVEREDGDPVEEQVHEEESEKKAEREMLRHLMLHYPKSKHCRACGKAKVIRRQMRRAKYGRIEVQPAVRFGDHVTCDHIIICTVKRPQAHEGLHGERVALLVRDEFTQWTKAYPAKTKSTGEVVDALVDFAGGKKIRRLYSDGAKE
ncbi:MAG: hypothetical protein GY721_03545, partial [Deltaproteobacteria bacterium]|nr:hypothetical protein [Deltaproteobacteria bacterium]